MANSVKVFRCCRRKDTDFATGRIGDRLNGRFDKVLMDAEDIEPCMNHDDVLKQRANGCDVLLAVIGDRWASTKVIAGRRRLDDPKDWVAEEIKLALRRKRVFPVLVDRAHGLQERSSQDVDETGEDPNDHGATGILEGRRGSADCQNALLMNKREAGNGDIDQLDE
ncbi:MAG TPA: toll/interleukin-1 receptor domain-containing protein [Dermatophilaceae bacterium]